MSFSLSETLLSCFISTLILLLVISGLRDTTELTRSLVTKNEFLNDGQAAARLIADTVNTAVFIYKPGSILSFGSGWTTHNFLRSQTENAASWEVGKDPILAFIQAPQETSPNVTCQNADDAPARFRAACAVFVAYYPIPKAKIMQKAQTQGDLHSWTLFEYRRLLPFKTFVPYWLARVQPEMGYGDFDGRLPSTTEELGGIAGRMLLDNLMPEKGFTVELFINRETQLTETFLSFPTYLDSAIGGKLQLRMNAALLLEVGIVPQNLYAKQPHVLS